MIKITLEDLNRKSPYEIVLNHGDFDFITEAGIHHMYPLYPCHPT